MTQVLVTVSGGIIEQVTFYEDPSEAIQNLAKYVKHMNPEKNDAAVYSPDGMIANAKDFLDEQDQFLEKGLGGVNPNQF